MIKYRKNFWGVYDLKKGSKYKREKVPASTVALYICAAVLILGICTVVFFVNFNAINQNNTPASTDSAAYSYGSYEAYE